MAAHQCRYRRKATARATSSDWTPKKASQAIPESVEVQKGRSMKNEECHQSTICRHVFAGAMPEVVDIENGLLMAALCFACADATEKNLSPEEIFSILTPLSAHQIPAKV